MGIMYCNFYVCNIHIYTLYLYVYAHMVVPPKTYVSKNGNGIYSFVFVHVLASSFWELF